MKKEKISKCTPDFPYSEERDLKENPSEWVHTTTRVLQTVPSDKQAGMSAYSRHRCRVCGQEFKVIID